MDDLISRQAAIDAIKEFYRGAKEWKDEQEERSDIWHRADSAIASALEIGLRIKKLPSAQQWIPCSERLPEYDGELYLVTDYCEQINRRRLHISYCYVNREGFWSDVPMGYKVIAWMPLPEPYKGE